MPGDGSMLLNSKSILDCEDNALELYNEETTQILNAIYDIENYGCLIIYKNVNEEHIYKEDVIKACELHDFMKMIEHVDIKNGIDFLDENGYLVIKRYG